MALFSAKTETDRLELALREVRLARPDVPRRRRSTVSSRGLLRVTVYLSPNEADALAALCSEYQVSRSSMLRALVRRAKPCAVDAPDTD